MTEYWPCLLAAVCAIAVLRCAARQRHGMRSLLAGAVCGLGALALQSRVFMHNIRFSFVLSRQAVRLPCSQSLG